MKQRYEEPGRDLSELDIRDGVLYKCLKKEGEITIPYGVNAVSRHAFDSVGDLRINYSAEEIEEDMSLRIFSEACHMIMAKQERITEFEEGDPCMVIFDSDSHQIENAIKSAIAKLEENRDVSGCKMMVIDIDEVNSINDRIMSTEDRNLVKVKGDSVFTFMDLPLLGHFYTAQFGQQGDDVADAVNGIIDNEGTGILFVKNLNRDNYRCLPPNFIYSLTKHHTFCSVRLSPRWMVVLGVGVNTPLDAHHSATCLEAREYKNLTPEQFMRNSRIVEDDADA